MPFRNIIWVFFIAVFAGLSLWILDIALLSPKPEPIPIAKEVELPAPPISTVAAITPPAQVSAKMKSFIDRSYEIHNYYKIQGWAFIEKQTTQGQEVYVQLKKADGSIAHFSTLPMEREDVATSFKNPLGNDNRKLTICDNRILTTLGQSLSFEMTRGNHLTSSL